MDGGRISAAQLFHVFHGDEKLWIPLDFTGSKTWISHGFFQQQCDVDEI
jgi:hypothetical protein